MKSFLLCDKVEWKDLGLFILRIGIGCIFIKHGWDKLNGGVEKWVWLGSNMQMLGITFGYMYWGCAVAMIEFCGGICLIAGFLTRLAAACMAFIMVMATLMHYTHGDPFTTLSHPLSLFFVFVCLGIAGSGKYSFDCTMSR